MAFEFMVCPHDTASNPDKWFLFVQYLVQHLDMHLQFDISLDFADFHENLSKADIVYANPSDTVKLVEEGFAALVHPSNLFDEVVFVAQTDVINPTLESLENQQIVSVESLLPTKLALYILGKRGITPAGITNCESWTSVIGCLWRNEFQFGLVYSDTYHGLSDQGKKMCQAFFTSDERISFHNILVGRKALEKSESIVQILLNMHTESKGRAVLKELNVEQWVTTSQDDIEKMKYIMKNY